MDETRRAIVVNEIIARCEHGMKTDTGNSWPSENYLIKCSDLRFLFSTIRILETELAKSREMPHVENGGMLMEVWRLNDAGYTAFHGVVQECLF